MSPYIKELPITSIVIAINVLIFIITLSGVFPPITFLSTPQILTFGSFLAHFSHFDLLHIFMNMAVFSQISPLLERALHPMQYVSSLMGIWLLTIFIAQPLVSGFSLGFSGILMGTIVMAAILYWHITPLRQQLLIMTLINIAIGFLPGISLLMHAVGALSGMIVGVTFTMVGIRRK